MFLHKTITRLLLALLGCLGVISFFWSSSSLRAVRLLTQPHSSQEIIDRATTVFEKSALAEFDLTQETTIELNKTLFIYAQTRLDGIPSTAFFPIGRWKFEWQGKVASKKKGLKDVSLIVEYDFRGRLIHFEQTLPKVRKSGNLKESAAQRRALSYLRRQNVDTADLELTDHQMTIRDDRLLQYEFTYSKPSPIAPGITESYDLKIAGRNIETYNATIDLNLDDDITPAFYRTSKIVSFVFAVLAWGLISVIALIIFFRKIRHDELEFSKGLQIGLVCLVLVWAKIALYSWGDWIQVLVGGALGGSFTAFGCMLIYSVTDAAVRDIWPQKLALLDVVWRGYFRVKEFGKSMLDSLALSGLTLFVAGMLFLIVDRFFIGHIEFGKTALDLFYDRMHFLSIPGGSLIKANFILFMLFLFWPTLLKHRIKNRFMYLLTHAISINFAGLHLVGIQPTFFSFIIVLPLALTWAYASLELDLIAIWLALFITGFAAELILLPALYNSLFSLPTLILAGSVFTVFAGGSLLCFSKRSVDDFAHYVPAYVSRIAERERFLKEIEIARNVQMRFLPQFVPVYKNLDIASVCQPAMEVGGDYYDFIQNGRSSLGIVIGDVSGKGVSAAFYMTMAKGIIKTLAKATNSPKHILAEMNTIFYENVPREVFISVIYGEFDLEKKVLKYARAGHNPLIIFRGKNGKTESVLPKGLAIGLDQGSLFKETIEEIEIPFEQNDVFLFFTDGVSEATNNNGSEFGETRLQQIISSHHKLSAREMLTSINDEIHRFAGKVKQHDDLTMVLVKIC